MPESESQTFLITNQNIGEIFSNHYERLLAHLRYMGFMMPEDAIQAAFVNIQSTINSNGHCELDCVDHLGAYLRTCVRNQVIDTAKKESSQWDLEQEAVGLLGLHQSDVDYEDHETRVGELLDRFMMLGSRDTLFREVLELRREGMSFDQIANVQERNKTAVVNTFVRGCKRLIDTNEELSRAYLDLRF